MKTLCLFACIVILAGMSACTGAGNQVRFILTFDDGPCPQNDSTQRILDALRGKMAAAFFVQTHVAWRGELPAGQALLRSTSADGHLVCIHTGSDEDHERHTIRAEKPAYAGGNNALESDMIRAKARLTTETNAKGIPFVRAAYGIIGDPNTPIRSIIEKVYKDQNLKHIHWDIYTGDSDPDRGTPADIKKKLEADVKDQINRERTDIIILFHDLESTDTPAHIADYIEAIRQAAQSLGKTATFPQTVDEIATIFNARTR